MTEPPPDTSWVEMEEIRDPTVAPVALALFGITLVMALLTLAVLFG